VAKQIEEWEFQANTKGAEAAIGKLGSSVESSFTKGALAAQLITKALSVVQSAASYMIRDFIDAEKVAIRLGVAMDAAGISSERLADKLDDQPRFLRGKRNRPAVISQCADNIVAIRSSNGLELLRNGSL
jgi:hypothetical protein